TALSTSPASPRIATWPSSSARTPARKIAWSSTRTTVGNGVLSGIFQHQLHFRALPGRAVHGGGAAVTGHPAHDRLSHAAPVGGELLGVEAAAAIADEDLGAAARDLDVER